MTELFHQRCRIGHAGIDKTTKLKVIIGTRAGRIFVSGSRIFLSGQPQKYIQEIQRKCQEEEDTELLRITISIQGKANPCPV